MTDLHYQIQGEGEPLILLHGGSMDSRIWQEVTPQLVPFFQLITYDSRGSGQSPSPQQPTNHVADLRKLIQSLELKRVNLIGHSLGGQIATDYALTYPGEVDKLVLIAPGLTGFQFDTDYQQLINEVEAVVPDVEKMLDLWLHRPQAYAMQASLRGSYGEMIRQIHRENLTKSLTSKNREMIWPQPPAIKRLGELAAPTLFVIGTADKADLFRIADVFRQVPMVQFASVEHADHGLPLTHATELVGLIRRFLSR